MTKSIFAPAVVACVTVFSVTLVAQAPALVGAAKLADSAAREIDRGTIEGDIDRLHAARTLLDRALASYPDNPLLLHYQGYGFYREAGMMYGLNRMGEIPALMEKARAAFERSSASMPTPETHALLASTLGILIGADPTRGPTLGAAIQQEMSAAATTGENNPRVRLIRGMNAVYTPAQYGGGLSEAEAQLTKAIELFDTDHPIPPAPSWGRAEAYAWLGQVLQKENKVSEARTAYEKALAIEPKYAWVKTVLLPSLKK